MLVFNWIVFILGLLISIFCVSFGIALSVKEKSVKASVSVFITAIVFAVSGYLAANQLTKHYESQKASHTESLIYDDTATTGMQSNRLYKDTDTGSYVVCIHVFGNNRALIAYKEVGHNNVVLTLVDCERYSDYVEMPIENQDYIVNNIVKHIETMNIYETYEYIIGRYEYKKD